MKKRILSLLLAVVMIVGMLPAVALAAGTEPGDVQYGSYDENGEWTANNNGSSASTPDGNITVKKEAVKTGDNTYEIKLTVEMKQTASTVAAPAATVLVIDCSGSMAFCAECGNGNGLLEGYRHKYDCKYYNFWDNAIQAEQTRLYAAKNAAYSFLNTYKGTASGIGRWVAVVGFGTDLKKTPAWYDVSTTAGHNAVKKAISDLGAEGGTNLDAGLRKADDLLKDNRFGAKTVKNVIALTDGMPTYSKNDMYDGGSCSKTSFMDTKNSATALKKSAALYTVCFGASSDKINDYTQQPGYWGYPDITVGDYLKYHISSGAAYAFNADNTEQLNKAFADITQTIMDGIVAGTVTDSLPTAVSTTDPNFAGSWELKPENATRVDESNGSKTYIYEKTYTVTIDPEKVAEGTDYQPLNNETYLSYGENGKINFPIPAGKVTRPEITYTLIYNANDGSGAPANATFRDTTGKTTSHEFDIATDIPTREGYTFIGWTEKQTPETTDTVYGHGENQTAKITVNKAAPDNCTKTLYAQWTKNPTTARVTITKTFPEGVTVPDGFVLVLKNSTNNEVPLEKANDSYTYTADLGAGKYTLTEVNANIDGKTLDAKLTKDGTVIGSDNGPWTITIDEDDIDKNLTYNLTNTYADYTPAEVDLGTLIKKTLTGTSDELSELSDAQKTFTVKLTPGHLANMGTYTGRRMKTRSSPARLFAATRARLSPLEALKRALPS